MKKLGWRPLRPERSSPEFDPDIYGDKLFGSQYRRLIKPHYAFVTTIVTAVTAVCDFLKNLYPELIFAFLVLSLTSLIGGGIWYFWARSSGSRTITASAALATVIVGIVAFAPYLRAGDTNSVSGMFPVTAELQNKLDRLVKGVETMASDTAQIRTDVKEIAKVQTISMPSIIRQRFAEAMKDGNGDELLELSAQGYPTERVVQLFQQKDVAGAFFKSAAMDENAIGWLGDMLGKGMSPDLIVSRSTLPDEGILVSAFRNGNFAAVQTILKHGANPHAYQDVLYHPAELPFFVSPLSSLIESQDFSPGQKKEIAQLMIANGLVVPKLMGENNGFYGGYWVDGAIKWLKSNGIDYPPVSQPCGEPAGLCKKAEYSGTGLCDFARTVPVNLDLNRAYGIEIDKSFVRALIGVYNGRAFYLANSPGYNGQVSLLSLGADQKQWSALKYELVQGNFCDEKTGGASNGCWLNTNLKFSIPDSKFPYGEKIGFCSSSASN